MKLRNDPRLYWSLAALYALGIFLLSANPKPPEPAVMTTMPYSDKIAHFFLYFFFGFLLYAASLKTKFPSFKSVEMSFLIGTVYAFTDEVHQYFVPGRSCDYLDFLVDALGISAGILFLMWKRGEIYKS